MTLATSIGDLVARGNALLALHEGRAGADAASRAAMEAAFTARMATMQTSFWVDQLAGNDANAGTQAAPLKTVNRAAVLTPYGGLCNVRFVGNYEFKVLDGSLTIANQFLHLNSANPAARSTLSWERTTQVLGGITYRRVPQLWLNDRSAVSFAALNINLPDGAGYEAIPTSWISSPISEFGQRPNNGIIITDCAITNPATAFASLTFGSALRLMVEGLTVNGPSMNGRWWAYATSAAGINPALVPSIFTNLAQV